MQLVSPSPPGFSTGSCASCNSAARTFRIILEEKNAHVPLDRTYVALHRHSYSEPEVRAEIVFREQRREINRSTVSEAEIPYISSCVRMRR
jgi:hypothetical protein